MADSEDSIPTLIDIMHPGNQEMFNHFDAHQFENKNAEPALSVENASEIENTAFIEEPELNEIPSITLDDNHSSDISSEDFSEAMQSAAVNLPPNDLNKDELKEKINQAITEALPGIEAQLKGKLYSKFGV